ncbi:MAG TPA: nucleotide exchange factor GrpE [Gemmatimonadaceae bacterium]
MDKRRSSTRDTELGSDAGDAPGIDPAEDAAVGEADSLLSVDAPPQEERERLETAVATERDKYLRLAAEFDNFRKRMIRERQEAGGKAQADLVQGLIEVLDDIMRFAHLDPSTVDSGTVVQGVAMVERKVMKTLSGHGLEVVDPVGRPFDPAFHEAVATEPAASSEEDHLVARVYQPGFLFRGQLLRPARVVVKQWLG